MKAKIERRPNRLKYTEDEFEKLLKLAQPDLELVSPFIRLLESIKVRDKLGIVYFVRADELLKGKRPTMKTSLNPNKAFEIKGKTMCGDKYDYSKVNYKNARIHVTLICPEHGDFEIVPDCHVKRGHGCPICARRQGELSRKSVSSSLWKQKSWEEAGIKSPRFTSFKFYVIRCYSEQEEFFKIGRTYRSMRQRFGPIAFPYNYTEEILIESDSKTICDLEDIFKKGLKDFIYTPKIYFSGFGECFSNNEKLKSMIQKLKSENA